MIYAYLTKPSKPWRKLCEIILQNHHVDPHDLYKDSSGKPLIQKENAFISWAHSKAHVLIALSETHAVGADCEDIRPIDHQAIQKRFFPNEVDIQGSVDFYKKWTEKEATCKLKGISIWQEMKLTTNAQCHHNIIDETIFCIATHSATPIIWVSHYETEKLLQKTAQTLLRPDQCR
ncbi:MAG: hypothetical protein FJ186_03005 [Gammaproteobacteria bacterium]|jgi:phosphopantetheinyl transferase|nr:hypothetical protein [Gammaproteobacteria bacterium]